MNLTAFFIRHPVFTIVISLVMTIVGLIGFSELPLRWIPNVNPPQVTISTQYAGATAGLVERDITKVIEGALSGISGMETLTSTSRRNQSEISITFKLGTNMESAIEEVRTAMGRIRDELPKDAENPVIEKADPNSNPIMFISYADQHKSAQELSDYIDKYVLPNFESLEGVGSVVVYGKRLPAIKVRLDAAKMAAANITVDEVAQLMQEQNASLPSGQIRSQDRFYSVVMDTTLKSSAQFNELILRDTQGQVVRLKDIGEAKTEAEDTDTTFRINGKPGIAMGILPQSAANPLNVEQAVKQAFKTMKPLLPQGMQADIIYNQADYIRASIHSVYEAFFEAVIFVWLVIFIFLCHFRATLIPIITIPVCLISTFALLYFLGFSINTITLMAFVLAIGLVVDDAIVMLENISRHIEEGESVFDAAIKGSREMIFPVIAMTLTLAAVYAPIAFTPGLLGVLFREFTFTLAGAVIISGIIALTLSPMMCAKMLRVTTQPTGYAAWFPKQLAWLQICYQNILNKLLDRKKWVLIGLIITMVIGAMVYHALPSELAPNEDMNEINVHVSAPRNASYLYTDRSVKELESIYNRVPEIASYLTISYAAPHSFHVLILKPAAERSRSTEAIMADITQQTESIAGARINVFTPPPPLAQLTDGDMGDHLGLAIMTSSDYLRLQQVSQTLMEAIKKNPNFSRVDNGLKWDNQQFQLNIDRDRSADLRVSIADITRTVATLIGGRKVGKTEDMNIYLQLDEVALANPNVFQELYVRNVDRQMVPLSNLVSVKEVAASEVFRHYNRLRADTIYLSLAPNAHLDEAIKDLHAITQTYLPDDMKFNFTGEAKSFLDSNGKMLLTFMLAIFFIYLVLAAQFESFIDPFIILLTVPFAMIGAMLTLKLCGGSFNIYSNIGFITLVGLIAKHGILITEFANQLRAQGYAIREAVIMASSLRLRPILMTTAAMVLGALPLAISTGAGAETRQQIGFVIAGGLLLGTFFSLIVIPITYAFFATFKKKVVLISPEEKNYAANL